MAIDAVQRLRIWLVLVTYGCLIYVDWIVGLPVTAFEVIVYVYTAHRFPKFWDKHRINVYHIAIFIVLAVFITRPDNALLMGLYSVIYLSRVLLIERSG